MATEKRERTYFEIPRELTKRKGLLVSDRLVLIGLCSQRDVESGGTFISVSELALFARLSRTTIVASVKRLKKAKIISVVVKKGETSFYKIIDPVMADQLKGTKGGKISLRDSRWWLLPQHYQRLHMKKVPTK